MLTNVGRTERTSVGAALGLHHAEKRFAIAERGVGAAAASLEGS